MHYEIIVIASKVMKSDRYLFCQQKISIKNLVSRSSMFTCYMAMLSYLNIFFSAYNFLGIYIYIYCTLYCIIYIIIYAFFQLIFKLYFHLNIFALVYYIFHQDIHLCNHNYKNMFFIFISIGCISIICINFWFCFRLDSKSAWITKGVCNYL